MKKVMSSWKFCPSIVGVTAGVIIVVAGLSKLIAGEQMLTGVGGMALGIFGVAQGEMTSFAYVLGMIAAVIEVVGGLMFLTGCCKTSRYAALGLAVVMFVALVAKLMNIPYGEAAGIWQLISGTIGQVQIEVLLLAVFAHKAIPVIKSCCGMKCDDCCGGGACPTK
jgi:uncharacterized membrane protein YphA (DoxX/SURF4 family)